jgi:hypothetical protein
VSIVASASQTILQYCHSQNTNYLNEKWVCTCLWIYGKSIPNFPDTFVDRKLYVIISKFTTDSMRNVYNSLVGKPKEKIPLGWLGTDRKVIFKWVLKSVDWIGLAQDTDKRRALVNTVTNLRDPKKTGNFSTRWTTISFSKRLCYTKLVTSIALVQTGLSKCCFLDFFTSVQPEKSRLPWKVRRYSIKEFPVFYGTRQSRSSSCSLKPATGPYSESLSAYLYFPFLKDTF